MTDSLDTPVIVVKRWTRYGKDRAYASLGDRQLGYRDLHSGDIVCEVPGQRVVLERATDELWRKACAARYHPRHAGTADEPSASSPAPSERVVDGLDQPSPTLLPDRDLARNQPAEAVRAQAKALRDAAPVRTRLARVLGVKTDERAWRIGGDAEEAVAKRLARLGPEWRVLHAIPVGDKGSDIDHLAIGPGGVFTINAKNHPDANVWVRGNTVKVNGFNQPYVRNSRHEAGRAAKLLTARALFDVEVHGVVTIMGMEKGFVVVDQPGDGAVTVVARKLVAEHLASFPTVLGPPSIDRIHDTARHLATWQPTSVAWRDEL